jgi:hypothetical protein
MKSTIIWDIMPYSPLKASRLFGGTYRLHFQGRISRASYQRESRWQAEIIVVILVLFVMFLNLILLFKEENVF